MNLGPRGSGILAATVLGLLVATGAAAGASGGGLPRKEAHNSDRFDKVLRENAHFFGILVSFSLTAAISDPGWGVSVKDINLNLLSREVRDPQGRQYVRARVAGVVRKNNNVELNILDENGRLVGKGFLGFESGQLAFFTPEGKTIIDGYFDSGGGYRLYDLRLPTGQQDLAAGYLDLCWACSWLGYAWYDGAGYKVGGGRVYPDWYSGSQDRLRVYWAFLEGTLDDSTPAYGEAEYDLASEARGAVNSVLFDNQRPAASYFANPYSQVPEPVGRAYLPRFTSDTGVAVTNPNDREIRVTCVARSYEGKLITGDGIENPVTYRFAPGQQVAAYPAEIFRSFSRTDHRPILGPGETGWIEIFSDDADVQALFLEGPADGSALDGNAAAEAGGNPVVFPNLRLKEGESSEVVLLNLSYDDAVVRLELLGRQGQVLRQEPEFFIAGFGMRNFYIGPGSNFLSVADFSQVGALRASCNNSNSILATGCSKIIGLATLTDSFGSLATSYAVAEESAGTALVGAHFVTGRSGTGTWSTKVDVVKTTGGSASVYLDLYDASGNLLLTLPGVISSGGQASFLLDASSLPWGERFTSGYLRVRSDAGKVGGDVSIAWSGGSQSVFSAYPLSNYLAGRFYFNQVAQGTASGIEYWTGIAVMNDLDRNASVTLEVYTADGELDRSTTVQLEPYGQAVGLLSQFLQEPGYTRIDGYIRLISTEPVTAIVLYGDTRNRFLSAVPGVAR